MKMVTFRHKTLEAWLDIKCESAEVAEKLLKEMVANRDHWTLVKVVDKKPLFSFG